MSSSVNNPATVKAVKKACEAYERAVVSNDVRMLQAFFWDSPEAVRFGGSEELYGFDEISAFRVKRVVNFSKREPVKLTISTFGNEFASVMFEYLADINGVERRGRQSQTWVYINDQWKIASAHVSLATDADKVNSLLAAGLDHLGLAPDPVWMSRIHENFSVTSHLAGRLMAFTLADDIEPAPVFKP